jgi:hypothetical protein
MSINEFKNNWIEAIQRAMLTRQPESELADLELTRATGLPVRSDLRAGIDYPPMECTWTKINQF